MSHRIVIVGGGAGGLELATRLGRSLGRRGQAIITLVDPERTSLWKPLLHEVAAGSLDPARHGLDYLVQARRHHFNFRLGRVDGLDRVRKHIEVAETLDEHAQVLVPRRSIPYDTLVIAVGSRAHYFDTPGAQLHAISLDDPAAAQALHRRLVNACVRASLRREASGHCGRIAVTIIGAGATGVELAAELRHAIGTLMEYGRNSLDPVRDFDLTLLDAGARVLPQLPAEMAATALQLLGRLRVDVRTSTRVSAVHADHVLLDSGERIPADISVWAAGIKAPEFLSRLHGLRTNQLNQLIVNRRLQTADPDIYALGDCAACPRHEEGGAPSWVPPRAQAAHQQAAYLARALGSLLRGERPPPFRYRDFGSLVSFGHLSTVGNIMGSRGASVFVEGRVARLMYLSLYKKRELVLHGWVRTALSTLSRWIDRQTAPHVKLH